MLPLHCCHAVVCLAAWGQGGRAARLTQGRKPAAQATLALCGGGGTRRGPAHAPQPSRTARLTLHPPLHLVRPRRRAGWGATTTSAAWPTSARWTRSATSRRMSATSRRACPEPMPLAKEQQGGVRGHARSEPQAAAAVLRAPPAAKRCLAPRGAHGGGLNPETAVKRMHCKQRIVESKVGQEGAAYRRLRSLAAARARLFVPAGLLSHQSTEGLAPGSWQPGLAGGTRQDSSRHQLPPPAGAAPPARPHRAPRWRRARAEARVLARTPAVRPAGAPGSWQPGLDAETVSIRWQSKGLPSSIRCCYSTASNEIRNSRRGSASSGSEGRKAGASRCRVSRLGHGRQSGWGGAGRSVVYTHGGGSGASCGSRRIGSSAGAGGAVRRSSTLRRLSW